MNVVEDEVMKNEKSIIIERIRNNKRIFNDKENIKRKWNKLWKIQKMK